MSPIALASAQRSVGRAVKGSGRRINAVRRRPSILELLATTGTIESLREMRTTIEAAAASGEITPSEKTCLEWRDAIWVRVFELMALQPHRACYIYNVVLTWPKPFGLQAALEAQLKFVTAGLPAPGELP